jgi:HD-like signal output (HDOD) protein
MSLREIHPRELKGLVKEIPTLPVIYQQLFRMMQDPDVSVPELSEVISQDQSLTAKILHLVNSAFYGVKKEIKTINRAVIILGFSAVRSAALAISVFDYFKGNDSSEQCSLEKFWEHSIAVAGICKVLNQKANLQLGEEAFVVGLLHDTGKLVMKKYFPADFTELGRHLLVNEKNWYEGEREIFKVDHAVIGKTVFRYWNFPVCIVEAIHLHHTPTAGASYPQLSALVHLADYLSYQLEMGSPLSRPPSACDDEALTILGLSLEQSLFHLPECEEEVRQAMSILDLVK